MTPRERIESAFKHRESDKIPVDPGATESSGITWIAYDKLKNHLGIHSKIKVFDLIQLIVKIEPVVTEAVAFDVIPLLFEPREWKNWEFQEGSIIEIPAGAEWALYLLTNALAGTNLIHDAGYIESGLTGSLESLVICDEIIGMVKQIISGIEINEETLALDMIKNVGPGGNFMGEDYTVKNFKKSIWYPSIFSRNRYENWQNEGLKDILQKASDRLKELL